MNRVVIGGHSLNPQVDIEQQGRRGDPKRRKSRMVHNPIKVVMDMMGQDGSLQQKIVNQQPIDYDYHLPSHRTTRFPYSQSKSMPKLQKPQMTPTFSKTMQSTQPQGLARSFVFNRFSYDNCRQFPIPKTRNSMPGKRSRLSDPSPSHKNLEIVYCQNKLGSFVAKTNEQIQELYRKEQERQNTARKTLLQQSLTSHSSNKIQAIQSRRPSKTSLATCLKEYATLEKLSQFMQSDQNMRDTYLCYEMEREPSRTLLLEIITHRFGFLKSMNKRLRDQLYHSLLGRPVNPLSKINIQQYMKISAMFVGRDASSQDMATFAYSFLFGERERSFQAAREKLQMLKGHSYKLKGLLEELFVLIVGASSREMMVEGLAKNQPLLRMFIDYIVERE